MGQRSQIYIRINDKDNNQTLIAKYFQWNYGERMISRARYGIEYIKGYMEYINQDTVQEKIGKFFDINLDMQDVALSIDILEEVRESCSRNRSEINDYIFIDQDNNDGKLFIDCYQETGEIKFCFTDYDMNILTPAKYMKWDMGSNWDSPNFYSEPELNEDWQSKISICKDNIKSINCNAKMMTETELESFIRYDYSKQIGDSNFKKFLQNFVEKGMKYDEYMWLRIEKIDDNDSWKLYNINTNETYMKYNNVTKELSLEPSLREGLYEGLIQDINDYYDLSNKKIYAENQVMNENIINNKEDIDYDYD